MRHWNRNQLCSIEISVTGNDPNIYEICEIAILPIDLHLNVDKRVLPVHLNIRPLEPNLVDFDTSTLNRKRYIEVLKTSMATSQAIHLIEQWWSTKLDLGTNKYGNPRKIIPLVYDAAFVIPHLKSFFGPTTYSEIFRPEYRDILSCSSLISDNIGYHGGKVKVGTGKSQWNYICNIYGAEARLQKGALQRALATSQAYKEMVIGREFIH